MKILVKLGKHSLIWQNRRVYFVLNEQMWFWTDKWQAGEREVEADIKAGRFTTYDNVEDFLSALDEDIRHNE